MFFDFLCYVTGWDYVFNGAKSTKINALTHVGVDLNLLSFPGYRNMVHSDVSESVIAKMKASHPNMTWVV